MAPFIPSLPTNDPTIAARMIVVEVIALTAAHRLRFESGEATEDKIADFIALGWDPDKIAQAIADFEQRAGRAGDVFSVRYWLRHVPIIVRGVEPDLSDVEARLTDQDIQTAVDVWCRPPRRPRKNEPKLPPKWEFLAGMFRRVRLGDVDASKLEGEWRDWGKKKPQRWLVARIGKGVGSSGIPSNALVRASSVHGEATDHRS